MSESASHELDLPLLSNNEDITVYHYVLELHCHFERKEFEGSITIFCKPVKKGTTDSAKLRGENLQSGCPHLDHQYASQVSITTEDIPSQHTCSDNVDSGNMSAELTTEYPKCYEDKVLVSESKVGTIHVPSQNICKDKACEAIQPAERIVHLSGCSEDNALSVGETMSQHPSYQAHTVLDIGEEHMLHYPLSQKENASVTHCHVIGETNVKADDKNDVLPTDSVRSLQYKTHITENPVLSTGSSHLNENSNSFEHARLNESGNETGDFEMILDCWEITVERVEEVIVTGGLEDIDKYDLTTSDDAYRTFVPWSKCGGKELDYRTDKQCVKIRKKGVKTAHEFPRVVRLFYRTHPKGYSLKWTKDQDGRYANFLLILIAPITTKVICFSRLPKCLRSLYGNQCGPRSDCSYHQTTLFASILKFATTVGQLFAADDFSRRHFQMHFFLGALRVNMLHAGYFYRFLFIICRHLS